MKPYHEDAAVTLWHGDSLAVLSSLPGGSVDCCVTSPPYFGLRDYGEAGQYGLEPSPAEYVETMRAVFAEVRRVLADDGTLWLNIGDSYSSTTKGTGGTEKSGLLRDGRRESVRVAASKRALEAQSMVARRYDMPVPPKNLLGIPWRTAFALQDDGWILRNDVIWSKPNGMPESVTDRFATKHEHIFMFSKSRSYWFELDAVRVPHSESSLARFESGPITLARRTPEEIRPSRRDSFARSTKSALPPGQSMVQHREDRPDVVAGSPLGRNPGDVWTVATQPFAEAHFAVMPQALAERAILAGCKPGGTVLDPFSGSGTTGLAANKHGRKYVGIDLSADYLDLSLRTRFAQPGLDLSGGGAA